MSELLEALILGVVQGLTEFLPVSSSGHLEIMKYILNDDSLAEQSMLTTVFLHFATALATLVIFRKDVFEIIKGFFNASDKFSRPFVLYIVISMIPAALVGVFFDDIIEVFFHRKIFLVGAMLIVTGILLWICERVRVQDKKLSLMSAFIIGLSQAVAIMPGISRSGSTIATSLLLGIDKSESARFSFLMVIPLIFGKIAKDLLSGDFQGHMPSATYLTVGFISAFIVGMLACTWMIAFVKKSKLIYFAVYCFVVGGGIMLYAQFA